MTSIRPVAPVRPAPSPRVAARAEAAPSSPSKPSKPAFPQVPGLPPEAQPGKLRRPNVKVERLDNGATIVQLRQPGAKTVDLRVTNTVGSSLEPKGKEGLAHLTEHLWFEGTPSRPAKELKREIDELGGMGAFNATTMDGETILFGTVLGSQAKQAADMLLDMYRNPSTKPTRVDKETRAVQQEIRMKLGSAGASAELAEPGLVSEQPRDRDGWGTPATVAAVTPGDVRKWAKQYFTGNNTVVFMAGDPDDLPVDEVRARLSKLPAGTKAVEPEEAGYRAGAQLMLAPHTDDRQTNVSMTLVGNPDKPKPANPAANMVLNQLLRSRMDTRMREQGWLTYAVSAQADGEAINVSTELHPRDVRTGVATMAQALRRLPASISAEDVEAIKRAQLQSLAVRAQDPEAQRESAFAAALGGSKPTDPNDAAAALATVSVKDVRAAARAMVDFSNVKVFAHGGLPADASADIRGGLRDAKVGVELATVPFDDAYWRKQMQMPRDPRHDRR